MHFWGSSVFLLIFLSMSSLNGDRVSLTDRISDKENGVEGKIIGGKRVSLTRYPSAALFFNEGALSAGTVLNSWSVLTAAHCFDNNKDKENMVIEVGARYLYDFNAVQYAIDRFAIHPDYNMSAMFACDIALIFVKESITFSNKIKKAILINNNKWMNPHVKHFQATGWGWTQYGGTISSEGLLMVELQFVSAQRCGKLHKLKISADMFCLYGNGTKDTCKGDSGGGILWNNMVVGITSHGDGCARKDKPSVYTNVWYFRKWIEKEVKKFIGKFCDHPKRRRVSIKTI